MEDLTGRQFGPYQIVAPLGQGGMAAVYKAYQPAMERYVALKILPRLYADDPQFVARFKQEAKILAQLQHPHILPVFDYGESDGYTYIVMPFVMSGTLADLIKGHPLPRHRIQQIISQVGDALNYAHAHGLIHRDVKPSNILVDESGNCLLTDFGLARMVESSLKLTNTGAVMGTPAYMSPEQGSGTELDGRSDIYSLGVVLYEMATGQVPYKAETPLAVVVKHIHDPLPSPRQFNPNLDEDIELIIRKALAKSPEDRYQTAGDMVRAIQDDATRKTLQASTPTVFAQSIKTQPEILTQKTRLSALPSRYYFVGLLVLFGMLIIGSLGFGAKMLSPIINKKPTAAFVLTSTPTLEPTTVPTEKPTSLPIQQTKPTPDLSPVISKFQTCQTLCNGQNSSKSFPEGIKKIYAQFNYENFTPGIKYVRTWSLNGMDWIRYRCNWDGPVSGTEVLTLKEPKGLHSGTWEITISVNDVVILKDQITVNGNWNYWDPAGTINACHGTTD